MTDIHTVWMHHKPATPEDIERAEAINRKIYPPITMLDVGEGDRIAVSIDATFDERRAIIGRFRRSRSAKKGWRTRRAMTKARGTNNG